MELYVLSAIDLRILIQIYIDGAVHWYSAVPRPRRYELGINVSSRASLRLVQEYGCSEECSAYYRVYTY